MFWSRAYNRCVDRYTFTYIKWTGIKENTFDGKHHKLHASIWDWETVSCMAMECINGVVFLLWATANIHNVEMILTSSLPLVSQWPEQQDRVTPDGPRPARPRTAPAALLHLITSRSNWSQTFWEQAGKACRQMGLTVRCLSERDVYTNPTVQDGCNTHLFNSSFWRHFYFLLYECSRYTGKCSGPCQNLNLNNINI